MDVMDVSTTRRVLSPGVKRSRDGSPVASASTANMPPVSPSAIKTEYPSEPAIKDEPSTPTSTADSSLSDLPVTTPQPGGSNTDGGPPAKKPKLTFAEKQVDAACRRIVKEEQAKVKAEQKAQKDEEKRRKAEEKEEAKRLKDLEKTKKDAEKAEKQKAKDEEKAAKEVEKAKKDAEKAQKEEEKSKKDAKQMRLSAFLGSKPARALSPPGTPNGKAASVTSRRSSVASVDKDVLPEDPRLRVKTEPEQMFYPFFVKEDMELAPINRFADAEAEVAEPTWVKQEQGGSAPAKAFQPLRTRTQPTISIRELVSTMDGNPNARPDFTATSLPMIKRARFKTLDFNEDVRPSYQGTYTRKVSSSVSRKLSRVPTYRGLPDTDYEYDSEAEWQEPEAGDEDLEDEDDQSEEEDGADEMDDFLDDENDTGRRAIASSNMEPISTGLCWEGDIDTTLVIAEVDLNTYRMQVMHDDQNLPINPYSTSHWTALVKAEKKAVDASSATNLMQPPRLPLSNVSVNVSPTKGMLKSDMKLQQAELLSVQHNNAKSLKPGTGKPVKYIPDKFLPAFKAAVSGNDLNKAGIVEILKKQFPECSKDAIKGSLDAVAERKGAKEADKVWVLR